jgi:tRNA A37 threonylcarbamoyladenosine synthetase subunit TsaC/SUA5/YrdC
MTSLEHDAERAYAVVRDGGLVLLPTDVGYGLIACGEEGVARIYELKGRPRGKPCITVANTAILDDVAELADEGLRVWIDQIARRVPIAVVNPVRRESTLLAGLTPYVRAHATTGRTIATFLNAGALVSRIAELALVDERIVVGSSANTAFTGNNYALEEVPDSIVSGVDLVIDGGPARYRNPERHATTILDLTVGRFLRKGIQFPVIEAAWYEFREAAVRSAV